MKAEIEEIEERAIAHVEAKFNCEVIEVQVSGTKITAKVKENGIVRELNIFATINELRKPTGKERLAQAQSVSKEERIIRNLEQMRQAGVTLASRRPSIYLRSA